MIFGPNDQVKDLFPAQNDVSRGTKSSWGMENGSDGRLFSCWKFPAYHSRRFDKMIARIWRGIAVPEKANTYIEHLQRTVLPELEQIDGFRGAYVLRRELGKGVEFTVQTLWESMDAIRKFAGENAEAAVVAPAARPLFRQFDSRVTHHQIILHVEGE
jgi:heme-degrading monooxygenase HmoA